jgi:hypothetical protein
MTTLKRWGTEFLAYGRWAGMFDPGSENSPAERVRAAACRRPVESSAD